jgi:lipopolysaccharide/colanic/teichoic acid biosynthesis glycosyltransferase
VRNSKHRALREAAAFSPTKRGLDVVLSALALVILSPVLLVIGALIVLDSGWPPLFVQDRVGRNGRLFLLFKFRTMVVNAEKIGAGLWIEPKDRRFTRLGPFLRKTSLDELVQLWNVLRGEMSLVGPRPMHPSTIPKLTPEQNLRHRVRPGITGWAVLHGRNSIPYTRRIELDNWYIDHWSIGLDLRILIMTVPVVLRRQGLKMDQMAREIDDLHAS